MSLRSRLQPTGYAALLLAALVAAGCARHHEDEWSRKWPPRYPSAGTVELDGQPLEGAVVTFFTEKSDLGNKPFSAVGFTDTAGRFVLKTFRPDDGAVAGDHVVMIEKREMTDGRIVTHLPAKYARKESSGLSATVTETGPNTFLFQLTSK